VQHVFAAATAAAKVTAVAAAKQCWWVDRMTVVSKEELMNQARSGELSA